MKTYASPASIILLSAALVASVFFYNSQNASGSVIMGGEYIAQQVTAAGTSSPAFCRTSVGSVILTSTDAGAIYFYATTTETATRTADLLFSFDGTATEGTYTYDVEAPGGVLIESRGFAGDAVVTCR